MYRECCLTSEKLPQSKCSCDTYAKKDVQKSGFLVSGCTGDFFKHNIIEMEISKMSARELCYNINNINVITTRKQYSWKLHTFLSNSILCFYLLVLVLKFYLILFCLLLFFKWGNFFLSFFYILFYFLTSQDCIGFAIYQHESATGIHMFPILNPPLSSLPIPSLWVVPVRQPQASSIVHRTWSGNSFHI